MSNNSLIICPKPFYFLFFCRYHKIHKARIIYFIEIPTMITLNLILNLKIFLRYNFFRYNLDGTLCSGGTSVYIRESEVARACAASGVPSDLFGEMAILFTFQSCWHFHRTEQIKYCISCICIFLAFYKNKIQVTYMF